MADVIKEMERFLGGNQSFAISKLVIFFSQSDLGITFQTDSTLRNLLRPKIVHERYGAIEDFHKNISRREINCLRQTIPLFNFFPNHFEELNFFLHSLFRIKHKSLEARVNFRSNNMFCAVLHLITFLQNTRRNSRNNCSNMLL